MLHVTCYMKKIVFSAVQPSGALHIGNYLGAIKNWVELQKNYRCIFCIADYHAITLKQNPRILKKKIFELVCIYLSADINPKKSIIFVQSQVPYHTELAWILNCITKISELKRMTQFKQKSKEHPEKVNVGLFDYPVLMASDILLYQTDLVPVGKDQKQHIELTRSLARRFNKEFGKTFKIPKALIKKQSEKIMGLDNPLKKMSKSAEDPYNYIALTDTPKLIREKIKKAITDSGKEIKYDKEKKPGISNLLTIYSLLSKKSIPQLENQYKNKTYAEFKKDLAEVIIKSLTPFQEKLKYYQSKPEYVKNILEQGRKKAEKISQATIKEAKKKLGLLCS